MRCKRAAQLWKCEVTCIHLPKSYAPTVIHSRYPKPPQAVCHTDMSSSHLSLPVLQTRAAGGADDGGGQTHGHPACGACLWQYRRQPAAGLGAAGRTPAI
eukprot:358478-Chlamydomonas_euryale.AAC.2